MPTLNELLNPAATFEDYYPPAIASVEGTLIAGEESQLIIRGFNFVPDDLFAALLPIGSDNFDVTGYSKIYVSPVEARITATIEKPGEYELILSAGSSLSDRYPIKANTPITEGTTPEELRSQGVLDLRNLDDLVVSKDEKVDDELVDIRHHKNSAITSKTNGISISRSGWISFPSLQRSADTLHNFDFIFYLSGDRFFSFGLADQTFNPNNTRLTSAGIVANFRIIRNRLQLSYGNGLTNYTGYQQQKTKGYYRFRINNNGNAGEMAELYLLEGADPKYWSKGTSVWKQAIAPNIANMSSDKETILTPIMMEYNKTTNPLLGAIAT